MQPVDMASSKTLLKNATFQHPRFPIRFELKQSAMLDSFVADDVAAECGVHPHPCMLFDTSLKIIKTDGDSEAVSSEHVLLDINTQDALRGMIVADRTNPSLPCTAATDCTPLTDVKCQYAQSWGASRKNVNPGFTGGDEPKKTEDGIKLGATDWTFSTTYSPIPAAVSLRRNTRDSAEKFTGPENTGEADSAIATEKRVDKASMLPLKLLQKPDPILFFESLLFYEDELDDSGNCTLDLKIRVHETFFFILLRNEVRVDNVIVRRMDTRFFGAFGEEIELARESESMSSQEGPSSEGAQTRGEQTQTSKSKKEHSPVLSPYQILREWSYSEVSFEELKARKDLSEYRPEQIMQLAEMLKPCDVKKHVGMVF